MNDEFDNVPIKAMFKDKSIMKAMYFDSIETASANFRVPVSRIKVCLRQGTGWKGVHYDIPFDKELKHAKVIDINHIEF